MTADEKWKGIGGGAAASYEDDSIREWRCGCYEDQHGYHFCFTHAKQPSAPPETPRARNKEETT